MKTANFLLLIIAILLLLNLINKSLVTEVNAQTLVKKTNDKPDFLNVRIVGLAPEVNFPVISSLDPNGKVQQPLGIVVLNKNYNGLFVPVFQVNK